MTEENTKVEDSCGCIWCDVGNQQEGGTHTTARGSFPCPNWAPPSDNLPPRPWNWVTSDNPSGNGAFHIYLVDATGRKIAALWGKGDEKQAMAEHLVKLVNGGAHASPA